MRKVKTLTPKQAKAYMTLALRNLKISPNEITEQQLWDEMEAVMNVYYPKDAIKNTNDIDDSYRIKDKK